MIQSIDAEGNITWKCNHAGENQLCGTVQSHHISHEQIKWHGTKAEHQTVSLPPCSVCGAQTFLKVHFTERELKAPNMWLPWTSERAQVLSELQRAYQAEQGETPHKASLAVQIQQLQAIQAAGGLHTETHAIAQNHMELARQLKASGKVPQQGES